MNKLLPLFIVVVVLGAGIYAFKGSSSDTASSTSTNGEATETTPGTVSNTSLAELIGNGKSVQCAVNTTENGMTTKGTVFVTGKKIRGDFSTETGAQGTVESHLLVNEESAYLWSSAAPEGIKLPVESTRTGAVQGLDYDKKKDYDCRPWSPDNSKFQVPTNIKFSDLGSLVQKAGQAR